MQMKTYSLEFLYHFLKTGEKKEYFKVDAFKNFHFLILFRDYLPFNCLKGFYWQNNEGVVLRSNLALSHLSGKINGLYIPV